MELAAELVQDIAAFLGVLEVDCLADFPAEMEEFGRVLDKVCPLLLSAQVAKCRLDPTSQTAAQTASVAPCTMLPVAAYTLSITRHAMPSVKGHTQPLQVQEHNATRIKMTAEMADSSNIVKALIVKLSPAPWQPFIKPGGAAYCMPLSCLCFVRRLELRLLALACHEQQEAGYLCLQAEDARILRNIPRCGQPTASCRI